VIKLEPASSYRALCGTWYLLNEIYPVRQVLLFPFCRQKSPGLEKLSPLYKTHLAGKRAVHRLRISEWTARTIDTVRGLFLPLWEFSQELGMSFVGFSFLKLVLS
jgi:hypothetical protein